MSELKAYNVVASNETENYINGETNLAFEAYDAEDVDALLAEKGKEITELKNLVKSAEEERDYYKNIRSDKHEAEIESLKASHYAESVDAGMRERRLRRALWIERAKRASAWQIHFALSHNHSIKREFTINGASSPHDRMVTMRTARDWAMIWKNVERKCRAKAEEYK